MSYTSDAFAPVPRIVLPKPGFILYILTRHSRNQKGVAARLELSAISNQRSAPGKLFTFCIRFHPSGTDLPGCFFGLHTYGWIVFIRIVLHVACVERHPFSVRWILSNEKHVLIE